MNPRPLCPSCTQKVQSVSGGDGGDEFGYDADWDDDWDIDRSLLGDDDEGGVGAGEGVPGSGQEDEMNVEALSVVPGTDEEVTELTRTWVQAGERETFRLRHCITPALDSTLGALFLFAVRPFSDRSWYSG